MYSTDDFNTDAATTAATLHLAYRRCQYLLARWWSGLNTQVTDQATQDLMTRVAEMVADYDANSSAKLNTVLAKSSLHLPGDD